MKKKEIIFFAILLIVAIIALLAIQISNNGDQKYVRIQVDGEEYKSFKLNDDTEMSFTIETEHGINEVVVADGQVDVVYADCQAQVCVNTKEASSANDLIVCLPHKLVIEILTEKQFEK